MGRLKREIITLFTILSAAVAVAQNNGSFDIFVQTNGIAANGEYAPYWFTK